MGIVDGPAPSPQFLGIQTCCSHHLPLLTCQPPETSGRLFKLINANKASPFHIFEVPAYLVEEARLNTCEKGELPASVVQFEKLLPYLDET